MFDLVTFLRSLTSKNRLAITHGFSFRVVSDLEGFGEALDSMQLYKPFIAASDSAEGEVSLLNTPSIRSVRSVFMFMPHPIDDNAMAHRRECFNTMREIFRQFLTVLIREHTKLHLAGLALEPEIEFQELDRYFFSGGACAVFHLAFTDRYSLIFQPDLWTQNPIPPRLSHLDRNLPRTSTQE